MFTRRQSITRRPSTHDPDHEEQVEKSRHRVANARTIRFWHFHRDSTCAGPTRIAKFLQWLPIGKILREKVPRPPPQYCISSQWTAKECELASPSAKIAEEIETFLIENYKGSGGLVYAKGSVPWRDYISNEKNSILLLRNPEHQICGMVASLEHKSHFGFLKQPSPAPRILDFLCIHQRIRRRGLAGWMMAWLDYHTHKKFGPCFHLSWSFQIPRILPSPFPSMCTVEYYKRVFIRQSIRQWELNDVHETEPAAALKIMSEISGNSNHEFPLDMGVQFDLQLHTHHPIYWWQYDIPEGFGCTILVGLCKTKWRMTEGAVWQVVYCSYVRGRPGNINDISMPFWEDSDEYKKNPQKAIELAATAQGCPVVLVSTNMSHYGGGEYLSNWRGWSKLREGSKLYIYNWMPKTFNSSVLWIGPTL